MKNNPQAAGDDLTQLDSGSDGGKPDDLTGPTTKTDLSADVKEAAGREVTPSTDPLIPCWDPRPPLPNYCGSCENRWLRATGCALNSKIYGQPNKKDSVGCLN